MTEKYTIKQGFTPEQLAVLEPAVQASHLPEGVVIYPFEGMDTLLAREPLDGSKPHVVVRQHILPRYEGSPVEAAVHARGPLRVPVFTYEARDLANRLDGVPGRMIQGRP